MNIIQIYSPQPVSVMDPMGFEKDDLWEENYMFRLDKPLQMSSSKMNWFLECSVHHKWMKNWKESYWFKRCFYDMNMP